MARVVVRGRKAKFTSSLDLMAAMNLITVLIPMILSLASFSSIKLLDVNLPEVKLDSQPQKDKDDDALLLTIFITDEGITLGARGAMLPTTYLKEFHQYVYAFPSGSATKDTLRVPITKSNSKELPLCPGEPGRRLTLYEREGILLYVAERQSEADTGRIVTGVYNKFGEPVTTASGDILKVMPGVGDTVFTLRDRRYQVVGNLADYSLQPLSLYDQLATRLMRVYAMYQQVPDIGEIRIVAEDDVLYDKIIHVMDICREFNFPKISLAKLAG